VKPVINKRDKLKNPKVNILYFNKFEFDELEAELANSWLEIDLNNLSSNIDFLRDLLLPGTKMMAVVKAEAYGHGSVEIALKASEKKIDYLGVATIAEAKILRKAGINLPILVLGSVFPEQIHIALKYDVEITLASPENIKNTEAIAGALGKEAKVHLKIDSGMGRVGVRPEYLMKSLELLKEAKNLNLKGVFTHFAESENPDFRFTAKQLKVFQECVVIIKDSGFDSQVIHAANSSATLIHPESHLDMVRVGLAMYGIGDPETPGLAPVMSLKSRIINMKEIPEGRSLGYGRSFFTARDSLIGIIPVGYADGFPRVLSNKQDVLIRGKRCPVVGNISMDQCLVDLTGLENPVVGDEVILLGKSGNEEITAREWAAKSYRIPYEVLCGFGNRLPRIYLK
jgi:alanine racemase